MLSLDNETFGKQVTETLAAGRQAVIRVRGSSMYPFIRDYIDLVTLHPPQPEHLKKGQIVFFRYGNRYLLHRIIRVTNGVFHIRGDNRRDRWCEQVSDNHIIGYVATIERNCKVIHCDHWRYRWYARIWMGTTSLRLWLYPLLRNGRTFLRQIRGWQSKNIY